MRLDADRKSMMILWGILALAFLLRFVGIGFGLPHVYHQDEPIVVNNAMAIGVRGWNPHFFVLPPFSMYFLFFAYAVYFLAGKTMGVFSDASSFGVAFLSDPTAFYLIGRFFLGVVFGVLAVYWLYGIARRHFSEKTAVYSALFLSVCYLHATHSHYIYADIPLVFFLVAMFGSFLDFYEKPSVKTRIAFAVFTGLSVSAKYTAVYFLPVYFLFYLFGQKKEPLSQKLVSFLTVGVASLAVFALVAPYTFLSWNEFYSQIHAQTGAEGFLGYTYHLRYSLANGVGWPVLLLAGAGIYVMMFFYRFKAWLILALCLVYYGINIFFSQPFTRYMLPLAPLLCLLAAFGWGVVGQGMGTLVRRAVLTLILIGSVLPLLYLDALFLKQDTRAIARDWIEKNIPQGSVIARDSAFWTPHLIQTPEQIENKYGMKGADDPAKHKRLDLMKQIAKNKATYNLFTFSETRDDGDAGFLFQKPLVRINQAAFKNINAQYLIVAYSSNEVKVWGLKEELLANGKLELVASFSPYRTSDKKKEQVDKFSCTAAPDDLAELFRRQRLGPYLEIFQVKS